MNGVISRAWMIMLIVIINIIPRVYFIWFGLIDVYLRIIVKRINSFTNVLCFKSVRLAVI